MNTPILFIIFNRPKPTRRVFEAIQKVKPKKLFIAADGPRESRLGEKEICEEVRNITKNINWDCEVKTLFREKNLGCGKAVSGAIDWFFENVEEGIILEDDCLPDQTFFTFCENLLEYHRFNNKIFMISGGNFIPKNLRPPQSYYFPKLPHIWGWATWKRAWNTYDFTISDFPSFKKEGRIKTVWKDKNTQNYFMDRFEEVYKRKLDTWDYQWNYCIWKNNGVCITPSVNLISNIGFGDNATHTLNKSDASANLSLEEIGFPLILTHEEIYILGDNYEIKQLYQKNYLLKKILKKIGVFNFLKFIYFKINKK